MSDLRSRSRDALHSLHNLNSCLFHWNFYRIHLAYFVLVIIVASVVLYGSNTSFHLSYADAIFLGASAMTNTGLNTVNLSALTAWQQAILFILMLMGDLTLVTVAVVYIRKHYFKKRLQELVEHNKVTRQVADDIEEARQNRKPAGQDGRMRPIDLQSSELRWRRKIQALWETPPNQTRGSHVRGYGAFPAPWEMHIFRSFSSFPFRTLLGQPVTEADHHYLTFSPSFDHKVCRVQGWVCRGIN
jgi:hypothetical protein